MSWKSLGLVTCTTAGVKYRVTANETDPTARLGCFALTFQNCTASQTGVFYIFDRSTGSSTTGVGLVGVVPALSGLTSLPTYTVSVPQSPGSLNAADYWVTGSVSGEKVLISCVKV